LVERRVERRNFFSCFASSSSWPLSHLFSFLPSLPFSPTTTPTQQQQLSNSPRRLQKRHRVARSPGQEDAWLGARLIFLRVFFRSFFVFFCLVLLALFKKRKKRREKEKTCPRRFV
jgi:hypothetical protein